MYLRLDPSPSQAECAWISPAVGVTVVAQPANHYSEGLKTLLIFICVLYRVLFPCFLNWRWFWKATCLCNSTLRDFYGFFPYEDLRDYAKFILETLIFLSISFMMISIKFFRLSKESSQAHTTSGIGFDPFVPFPPLFNNLNYTTNFTRVKCKQNTWKPRSKSLVRVISPCGESNRIVEKKFWS